MLATLCGVLMVASVLSANAATGTGGPAAILGTAGFHPLTPARILDTRDGVGGPKAKFAGGETRDLDVTGVGGVPDEGVSGVIINVTAVLPSEASFLTVWPTGVARPVASNLNFVPGEIVPNLVTVKVGGNGKVSLFNKGGSVDVIGDVVGWFDTGIQGGGTGDRFAGVTPARILDTRNGTGGPATKFGQATKRDLTVAGVGGVPATGATAVVLNVTAVLPSATSHLVVWPTGVAKPDASNLNYDAAKIRPNLVVVKLGTGGKVSLYNNSGTVDVLADVVGWFGPEGTAGLAGGGFEGVTPARVMDSREGIGGPMAKFGPGTTRTLDVTGVGGVPSEGVAAVVLNVTAVAGSATSHLTVWPADVSKPDASNLNFIAGQVVPNLVMVKLSATGTVNFFNNSGNVDVVADVVGWYAGAEPPETQPPDPKTIAPPLDTELPTEFSSSVAFLYQGSDPVQVGVAPGVIDPNRVTVVTGKVIDRSGAALPGARVDAPNAPALGHTFSRADGEFDFVINGGMSELLRFTMDGRLPADRWAPGTVRSYVRIDDVALVPLDPVSTVVSDGNAQIQVAKGSPVTESIGNRTATLLVPAGQDASLRMPDGSTQDVSSLTIRATEFTVGDNGPNAMPGELPPSSGYTYAVEFSADEAIAAGAASVELSKPIVNYTENFLGFPVGTRVPSGYFDRTASRWIASDDGVVLKIVSESGGRANVDVTGDDVADTGAALTALGIDNAERAKVAELYAPGQSLWRVLIPHFTPWDHNFPYTCTAACQGPRELVKDAETSEMPKLGCKTPGSIIGCQDQTLGETYPVLGTPYSLSYNSSTSPAYKEASTITVPVTGAVVPAGLDGAKVEILIGGQFHNFDVPTTPNQTLNLAWDGKDRYGRPTVGVAEAQVSVFYNYTPVYREAPDFERSFGLPAPGTPIMQGNSSGRFGKLGIITSSTTMLTLRAPSQTPAGGGEIGGWSIDAHKVWQREEGQLFLDNGAGIKVGPQPSSMRATGLAGGASAAALDGSLLFVSGNQIKRRAVDGAVTVVAGTGTACSSATVCGEGTQATLAAITPRGDLAIGGRGAIYFVEGVNCGGGCTGSVVRRIAPDGKLGVVAGNGSTCADVSLCSDPVQATATPIKPDAIAVDASGAVSILERRAENTRVRVVEADGRLITHVGCFVCLPGQPPVAEGNFASDANLEGVIDLASTPDGDLVLLSAGPSPRVLTVRGGRIHVLAGSTPCGVDAACGDEGPPREFRFDEPLALSVSPNGEIVVLDRTAAGPNAGIALWRFQVGGVMHHIAGAPGACPAYVSGGCGDGGPALSAALGNGPISAGLDGNVFVSSGSAPTLRHVKPADRVPGALNPIPSPDGREVYLFTDAGRHAKTVDAMTGITTTTFSYNPAGQLVGIADRDGNVTALVRDANGRATKFVTSLGLETSLGYDNRGNLALIGRGANGGLSIATNQDGLIDTIIEQGFPTALHTFEYDALGRLTRDNGAEGASSQLARTTIPQGVRVTVTSAQGRTKVIDTVIDAADVKTVTSTDENGGVTTTVTRPTGDILVSYPDGSSVSQTFGPHPTWGGLASVPVRIVQTLPGGLTNVMDFTRTVTTDPADASKVLTSTEAVSSNGDTTTTSYVAATRTTTVTSPEGRVQTAVQDPEGHIVRVTEDTGLTARVFTYRADGRLTKVARGARSLTFEYDGNGRQSAVIDATGKRLDTTYDSESFPNSTSSPNPIAPYQYINDARGQLIKLGMPPREGTNHTGQADYDFTYDEADRVTSFTAAGLPTETSTYSADGDLLTIGASTGGTITRTHDAGGRLTGTTMPGQSSTRSYSDATGRVTATSWDGFTDQAGTFSYQGYLVTGSTMSGAANATFTNEYDSSLRLTEIALAGGVTEAIGYDDDGAVVTDGPYTIVRSAPGGRPSSITDGTATFTNTFDAFGDETDRKLAFGGTTAFRQQLTRDAAGRVTSSTVTDSSGTHTSTYTYGPQGQLATWQVDGGPVTTYAYDLHGNLLSTAAGTADFTGVDFITSIDGEAYSYDANGALVVRGPDVFGRDATGKLLTASVGGSNALYTYDAMGRRVARSQGPNVTEYLYGDPTRPFRLTASRQAGVLTYYFYESGRLIGFERAGERFYVGTDQVGTPRVVRNAAGSTVKEIGVDPWGNVLSDSNPAFELAIGFAGGVRDPLTGWVRFGMRDYDPATGRFTSRDPVRFKGGHNLYAYSSDDPVNRIDPTGTTSIGGEFYAGGGGGFELSWGPEGWTFCLIVGVGLGGSVSGAISNERAPGGGGISAGVGLGGFGFGGGASANVFKDDCGRTTADAGVDVNLGPAQGRFGSKANLDSGTSENFGQVSAGGNFGPSNAGAQGRVAVKVCQPFGGE